MNPGLVLLEKGGLKPFFDFREIKRGKNKGKIELMVPVVVGGNRGGDAYTKKMRKCIVHPDQIRRYPSAGKISANFGEKPFKYQVPNGCSTLNASNHP